MNLQSELLKSYLSESLSKYLQECPVNVEKETESKAIQMLGKVKKILENPMLDDFEKVEEIASVFRNQKISVPGCHDF